MFVPVLANYTLFSAVWTTFALVALVLPQNNPVSPWLASLWLAGMSWQVGGRIWHERSVPWRFLIGLVTFGSAAIVAAGLVYYVYRLDAWGSAAAVILPAVVFGFIKKKPALFSAGGATEEKAPEEEVPAVSRFAGTALAAVIIALTAYSFGLISSSATDLAKRTPWDIAPPWTLTIFFLIAAAAVALALSGAIGDWIAVPTTGLALLAVGVAVLAYAVGYGFDPFIHQAAETVIYREGVILPKTSYYVGQYAAVVMMARLFKLAVNSADAWLLPAVFSIVPAIAYWSLRRALSLSRSAAGAAALLNLLLPLSPFIATTPQGLADVFVLLSAWLALPVAAGTAPLRGLAWPVLAAAVIHPIAGLPLVAFFMMLAIARGRRFGTALRRIALAAIFAGGALALPAAFYINSGFSGSILSLGELASAPQAALELLAGAAAPLRQFILTLDAAYFWQNVRPLVIILFAVGGAWTLSRRHRAAVVWPLGAMICLANWLLLRSAVKFPFLIEYERSGYADRLLDIALILLLPMAAVAVAAFFRRLAGASSLARLTTVVLFASLLTASVYLAYPRRDEYDTSRGWSTSAADIQAVDSIEKDAAGRPYAVLANQSVSAAAIRQLGFKRYFPSRDPADAEPVFFYPVPTGGPLYARFLEMNARRGAADAAAPAMNIVGTDLVYYVVTDYWWDARRIVANAKKEADGWWSIEDRVYVFRYVRE